MTLFDMYASFYGKTYSSQRVELCFQSIQELLLVLVLVRGCGDETCAETD